jgi:MFS family permease
MIKQFSVFIRRYPLQFWLLIFGQLICATGSGFIWPFIAVYIRDALGISLSAVSLILTLRAGATLLSSFFIGPITDTIGRKVVLVTSLFVGAISFFLLDFAHSILFFVVLMAGWGATQPLYRISTEAMIADLIQAEDRLSAYSLLRISMNVGVALGPIIGGVLVGVSYSITFYIAAACMLLVSLYSLLIIKETLDPQVRRQKSAKESRNEIRGILQDKNFLLICLGILIVYIMSSQVFVLLSNYLKENFGITENQTGWIMAVNAFMIISLQFFLARFIQKFNPISMMALGALCYMIGVSSNGLGNQTWHFAISMMIVTLGELILAPTTTTFTANYAPPDRRGRYISMIGLANGVGYGMGPVLGALFNDYVSPQATWFGSGIIGIGAVAIFYSLIQRYIPGKWAFKSNPEKTIR